MPLMCEECKCSNWLCHECGESNKHDCECTCCGCECQNGDSDNSDNSEADSVALILNKETALLLADSLRIAISNYDFDGDYETSEKVEEILKQVQP